jgi:hypothetical protein
MRFVAVGCDVVGSRVPPNRVSTSVSHDLRVLRVLRASLPLNRKFQPLASWRPAKFLIDSQAALKQCPAVVV